MPDERQSERVGRIKDFLKSRTSVPCHSGDIGKATGLPKALIDYQRSLSADPQIVRETHLDPQTGRRRVFWTHLPSGRPSAQVAEPRESELLTTQTANSGLDKAREVFASEQLTLPPVPDQFKKSLRAIGDWCFATRIVDAMRMYFFDDYLTEVLTKETADYVAFSHAGYGINSYALNYQLVYGPLAIIAQVGWGGGYSDKQEDTKDANALFVRCAELISASERAKARGLTGPPGRLVVIESDMRQQWLCGWLNRPLRGQAARGWLRAHSVTPSVKPIRSSELPTVTALKWLNSAPEAVSKRTSGQK